MIGWLTRLLFGIQLKQVQKLSVANNEQLVMIFKTEEMDIEDLQNVKRIIERNMPDIAGRVMLLVSPHDIDLKTVVINKYLQDLKGS